MKRTHAEAGMIKQTVSGESENLISQKRHRHLHSGNNPYPEGHHRSCSLCPLRPCLPVDFFVSSEEAGVEKPEARFFSRCLTKADCNKEECLFVGDSLKKDVYGAINAGFKAVWYCPKGNQTKTDVLQISNMMQLVQIVFADNDLPKY